MNVLRLLAVTTSFPLRPDSSAGVFVRRLYESLPGRWQVDVVCPDDDASTDCAAQSSELQSGRTQNASIRATPVRYAPRRWRVLAQRPGGIAPELQRAPWGLVWLPALLLLLWWRCLLLGRRVHVLHANWAVGGAIAASAGILIRRPLVTTLRGDDVTRAQRSVLDRWLLDIAVHGSAAIVCVSEAMAAQLRSLYPHRIRDIHVCLNGVDPAFLGVERSPPRPGRLRVAAVGSLISRKGYDILIEALARSRNRGCITMRIAGAGPELASLRERAARLGVLDHIDFVGQLPPERIPPFLAQADLFALPSRSEGRPNVVMEALAAGLPVLSSDLPGVMGLVVPGVNGWIVPTEDASGFAAALDEACTDAADRESRAAAARSGTLRDGRDWSRTGACYDALFLDVLAARGMGTI